jgi:hypothetical protein
MKYPPYSNIIHVLDQCPIAILVYISLWKIDDGKTFSLKKKEILHNYLPVFPDFYTHLSLLQKSKILSFFEEEDNLEFQFFLPEIKAEGNTLC